MFNMSEHVSLLYILIVTAMKSCSPLGGYQRFGGEYCLLVRHMTLQQFRPSRSHKPRITKRLCNGDSKYSEYRILIPKSLNVKNIRLFLTVNKDP